VDYLKKRIMLVFFLITILFMTALIPGHAEEKASTVKWTQKDNNLYETQTFYYTVLTRVIRQDHLYLLDKLVGQLDEIAKQTSDFIGSEFQGSFGLFVDLYPDAGSFKWEQYRSYFKTADLTGYINLGNSETMVKLIGYEPAEIVGPFIAQLMFAVSSKAEMPFWMDEGLGQWCYDNLVKKNMSWANCRKSNSLSFGFKADGIYIVYPLAAPQTWSASTLNPAKAVSIFYFLEHKFGREAITTFMKTWLADPKLEPALQQAFGSSLKDLESDWRRFVLFEGVSQYQWEETSSAYQVAVPGAVLSIKKTSTLWYDEVLDKQVQKIAAANALIESCQPTFKKTPVLKFEFYKNASKNSIKKSSSGFDTKVTDKGSKDLAAEFLKVATDKAIAALKLKSLPKSAVEGFSWFIGAQAGIASYTRNADFFDPSAATAAFDQEDVFNAMSFLQETYGSSKIVPLMSELNKGNSLRAAVIAAAGESEEKIDAALDFVRYLPTPRKLEWVRIPGGFRAELGDLRFDVENQAIKTRMKSDLEQTLTTGAEIAQRLSVLTGWKPDAASGKVTVRFGAGESDGSESIFIPISTDNFEYAAEDLHARITDYWLTMAGGGSKAPSWLVYGLSGVLKGLNPKEVVERVKTLTTVLVDWTAPFGAQKPSSEQQDLWFLATHFFLGEPESMPESNDNLKQWLAAAAQDGFEAGMEEIYGFNTSGLFDTWRCYMQVSSRSNYDWLIVAKDDSSVIHETIINDQRMRVLMAADGMNYQPGYDTILEQLAQNPAKFAGLIGMAEVPQLTLTLDISGRAKTFFQHNGTEVVIDAVSERDWSYSGAATFEMARCIAELHWQSFDSGAGANAVAMPIWLRDGLASYFMNIYSHGWEFSYHASKKALTPDSSLYNLINSYRESQVFGGNLELLASLFGFLEEKQSGCLKTLFAQMAEGAGIEQAIRAATGGQELAAVEAEWLSRVRK